MEELDIVICVSLKNCFFLKKNIRFIRQNIKPFSIYIITDKRNFKYLSFANKYENVYCLDEDSLLEGLNFHMLKNIIDKYLKARIYGWYFQQFLKMGFARSKYAKKYYLVWDADTVPLNPLNFIVDNKYQFTKKKEHHEAYFRTMDRLIDVPIKADFSFIAEHMIFDTKIMNEILDIIERCRIGGIACNAKWFEKIILSVDKDEMHGFSEFETYGTYCLNYYPDIFEYQSLRTLRRGGKIFGIHASLKEINSLIWDFDIVSFELYDYPLSFFRGLKQWLHYMACRCIVKIRQDWTMPHN